MECKCGNSSSFDYYFTNGTLIIRCLNCNIDYLEEEVDFDYWEEKTNDNATNTRLDRRTKKRKNMLGLF